MFASILGEVATKTFVSRCFDFLYEKEVIDEDDDKFILSKKYSGSGQLLQFLDEISCFRSN